MCLNCNFRLIWLKQLHCEKCWRYVTSFPAQRWPWFFTRWCSRHLSHPWRSFPSAELRGHSLPAWLPAEQHWEGIQGEEAERKRQGWLGTGQLIREKWTKMKEDRSGRWQRATWASSVGEAGLYSLWAPRHKQKTDPTPHLKGPRSKIKPRDPSWVCTVQTHKHLQGGKSLWLPFQKMGRGYQVHGPTPQSSSTVFTWIIWRLYLMTAFSPHC